MPRLQFRFHLLLNNGVGLLLLWAQECIDSFVAVFENATHLVHLLAPTNGRISENFPNLLPTLDENRQYLRLLILAQVKSLAKSIERLIGAASGCIGFAGRRRGLFLQVGSSGAGRGAGRRAGRRAG